MYTLYSLTSELHSEPVAEPADERFIQDIEKELGEAFKFGSTDFSEYSRTRNNIIYVRTGGTEGIFKSIFCKEGSLNIPDGMPVRLLTSGKSNSLAASMEILSFLNRAGWPGEILHGSAEEIALRLRDGFTKGGKSHVKEYDMGRILEGYKVGVIGKPSDWLISSDVDYAVAKERLGVEIVDIDINELVGLAEEPDRKWLEGLKLNLPNKPKFGKSISGKDFSGSMDIYCAMKTLVERYGLAGVSLRCFDLLTALGNTGCMALAILNSQGVVATCEGDIPTLLSMCIAHQKFGISGFQANLSRIDGDKMLFAHCTVPLNMVEEYSYDTHFESGIGVAVHGVLPAGAARIFKLSPDCSEMFLEDVEILENQYNDCLCRTQILVDAPGLADYFLRSPIGNHHVIIPERRQ